MNEVKFDEIKQKIDDFVRDELPRLVEDKCDFYSCYWDRALRMIHEINDWGVFDDDDDRKACSVIMNHAKTVAERKFKDTFSTLTMEQLGRWNGAEEAVILSLEGVSELTYEQFCILLQDAK